MHRITFSRFRYSLPTTLISVFLIAVGICVLLSWHAPETFARIYPYTTLMAYNTAIGFIACGLGLLALMTSKRILLIACSAILLTIAIATLLDIVVGVGLGTTNWFVIFLAEPPLRSQPISPATSSTFLLAGCSLLCARYTQGNFTIATTLGSLMIVFVTLAAVVGQGFGIFPTFIWLGIKMAPQTAVGLLVFASALFALRYAAAIEAFNRLNFFSRLATGFIFMSLLFIGIGSIGLLQINSVASISQQLYQGPLQTTTAVLRIKRYAIRLNRAIKDVAVNPTLAEERNIPQIIEELGVELQPEIALIQRDPKNQQFAAELTREFDQWRQLVSDIHKQLLAGDVAMFKQIALTQSQEKIVGIEELCDKIALVAQEQMQILNEEAVTTRNHSANLMIVVISCFLAMGIVVSALITRSLSWQLERIRQAMLTIANGDTQIAIPFNDHPHEIGDMAKTLKIFAHNIDERKKSAQLLEQHQRELEKSNQRLEQTNKELETFAYVASHDLKSPLRGIAQLSNWIDEDLAEKEFAEVGKHTQMLRNRIQRMEKLLDDMLVFYRAGKIDGNITRIDLAHMAKELFEIQNTKAGLHLELGDNLPVFDSLSTPFEQILRNLFSNAIKHHDLDEGVIRIEGRRLNNDFYEISVSDDGPGIPTQFQERVFGMFQTLRPRDELEGSGMGLALIRKIVETYRGKISVHSDGRGCRFTFTWPQTIKRKPDHD
jgi:signal transduction histidine kinase